MGADAAGRLEVKVAELPAAAGVYLLKDAEGKVIYVGKAKSLRARVRSYLSDRGDERAQLRFLRGRLADVEVVVTGNEKEALILENNLIKRYQPRYNVKLRDDKTYYHLKLTTSEPFPRLLLARRPAKGRDLLFGPYASSVAVKETIALLQEIFPLRRCSEPIFRHRSRPCLNCQIKKCLGPCCQLISPEDYQKIVDQVALFLKGKDTDLLDQLRREMEEASDSMEFERAAGLRDQIRAIEATLQKQKVDIPDPVDRDVFGLAREADRIVIHRLGFRSGTLLISRGFALNRVSLPDAEALGSFLKQFYAGEEFVPEEVLISLPVEDAELLAELLSERRGKKVTVAAPERGEKKRLVEMAEENARQALSKAAARAEQTNRALEELQHKLRLTKRPGWIEGYDISNLMGRQAVGSLVKFVEGEPDKSGYRRYQIKTVEQSDDYAMMQEVLTRRFRRALAEGQALPDLVLLDGGKGQLNIGREVLKELGIKDLAVVALAKEREIGEALSAELKKKGERVYLPGVKDPVWMPAHTAGLHLIQRIRDEAHRFAVAYHRRLRRKAAVRSELEEIPGIGPKKRNLLLKHLGGVERIKRAGVEELAQVPGISRSDAERIRKFFGQAQDE
jgi:excinuclease ABC subunit C